MKSDQRLKDARQYWDHLALSFDSEPDHGLQDPLILANWTHFLATWLPNVTANILDIGCGTGSLSVVLAGLGHQVTGVDLSPNMIALAQAKAVRHGYPIEFQVMDATYPQLAQRQFDVIVCRHLLWALPEPKQVLQRWTQFLKPPGRLILIEGYWETGAGLHANEILEILPTAFADVSVHTLSEKPNFWGKAISDERYAIIATLTQ